jgi:putative intracellular protease/amidase
VRTPLFRDRPSLAPSTHGPLLGARLAVVLASADADVHSVRVLAAALRPFGVTVVAACERHGEVHGDDGHLLFPALLAVEIEPAAFAGLVIAGGAGARVWRDDHALGELARAFVALGRPVAALGEGRAVLDAAGVRGLREAEPVALAARLLAALALPAAPGGAAARGPNAS